MVFCYSRTTRAFKDKVFSELVQFFTWTNCSWQHNGWPNISPNVKGLAANEVWPYQEPGPIHLKADPLSPCTTRLPTSSSPRFPSVPSSIIELLTAAVEIAVGVCTVFLCILGYSGNGSVCLGQWMGVHLVVCLSIRHSNIFDTALLSLINWDTNVRVSSD